MCAVHWVGVQSLEIRSVEDWLFPSSDRSRTDHRGGGGGGGWGSWGSAKERGGVREGRRIKKIKNKKGGGKERERS